MTAAGAIGISIGLENGFLKLRIKSPEQPLLSLPLEITPLKLTQLRKALGVGLRKFVEILAENGVVDKSPGVAERAMRQLYAVGAEIGLGIFRGSQDDVGAFLRAAAPGWANAGQTGYAPPAIVLDGSLEYPLPLEFIPLFDTSEPDFSSSPDITSIAARFPVFSTYFCRSTVSANRARPAAARDVIENSSSMLVRLFVHEGLRAAAAEHDFFSQANGVNVRGPWPDADLPPTVFIDEFSDRLLNARDPDGPLLDDVQHFSCHCDTESKESRDHAIQLARRVRRFGIWPNFDVYAATLGDLERKAFGHSSKGHFGPLVFLNACGSSKITPEGVMSFPDLFLLTGSCGVIGTEVAVPDLAAAEFARTFYIAFMAGKPIGEAIYEARVELLRRANPIGAIYSAYARPDLRLRNPVAVKSSEAKASIVH